jgi:PAS domain S-box-containing protein
VASTVSPRRQGAAVAATGSYIDELPEPFARCLIDGAPSVSAGPDNEVLRTTPLLATNGQSLGCLILRFVGSSPTRAAEAEGPEVTLAHLAAFAIETRRAENALAELRQRNELILGATADGILGVDADGRVTFSNPAATRLLGCSLEDLIGRDVGEILRGPAAGGEAGSPIFATLKDGQPRQVDKVEIRGDGGRPLPVRLVVTPIARHLSSLRAVVIFDDISAQIAAQRSLRRAAEEAEAASRSKSNFLAHMSHELRTPLNAIIGFSEVMSAQTLGPLDHSRYLEYAEHIHVSGEHLLSLINDLLDLSKIEAGKLELWEETVDLAALIKRCRVFVEEPAQNKGVTLTLRMDRELPDLRCDSRKLKQVLVNLLSNAVKFTPAGGRIVLEAKPDGADGVVIEVSDTGIGIAAENIEKVMSPFGQVNEALNRDTEGTGLGLPLSKALVELHGGRLFLKSAPGMGTVATVQLPERAVPRQPATSAPEVRAGGMTR